MGNLLGDLKGYLTLLEDKYKWKRLGVDPFQRIFGDRGYFRDPGLTEPGPKTWQNDWGIRLNKEFPMLDLKQNNMPDYGVAGDSYPSIMPNAAGLSPQTTHSDTPPTHSGSWDTLNNEEVLMHESVLPFIK